jgi:mono/diheme cytochrome c family protein
MSAMRVTTVSLIALAGLAAALGAAGCVESSGDEPVNPSYSRQIKPLIEAHCIRCHGAGGTLNQDPDIPDAEGVLQGPPVRGDFTQLADNGKIPGLAFYTNSAPDGMGASRMLAFLPQMPPPPGEQLTKFEHDILVKWINNPLP